MSIKDVNDMCPHCAEADAATLSALRSCSEAKALARRLAEALMETLPAYELSWSECPALARPKEIEEAKAALAAAKAAGVVP